MAKPAVITIRVRRVWVLTLAGWVVVPLARRGHLRAAAWVLNLVRFARPLQMRTSRGWRTLAWPRYGEER